MSMVIQIVGSIAILVGYALAQLGILDQKSIVYLLINTVGSGLLAAVAIIEHQWGFLLLEGSWSIISIIGLFRIRMQRH